MVVGARPQFIKSAPLEIKFRNSKIDLKSIHTGQHYDSNMSDVFYNQFELNNPEHQLNVGSSSHGIQTAKMLEQLESIFIQEKPDMIVVFGDTNSTLAASLAASKLGLPIAHIEAGLRSYNREMPEEINRVLTDHVSSLLFVPSHHSAENLLKEGISQGVIESGDVMMDILRITMSKNNLINPVKSKYYYATIHRPYNTDSLERLISILNTFNNLAFKVVFSIHPRTSNILKNAKISLDKYSNILFIPPQGYIDNLSYMQHAERIITDSGGIQKEAWFLKKPCITIRPETEWTETLKNNWNKLVYENLDDLLTATEIIPGDYIEGIYGNGYASDKIYESIVNYLT